MRTTRMSIRLTLFILLGCLLITAPGCSCGGDPVARRLARGHKRDKDDDEEMPVKPKPAPAAPGATSADPATPGQPVPAVTNPGTKPGAAPEEPAGGAESIVIDPIDPANPLDLTGRRQQTIARLKKIGLAIGDYARQHKQYPNPAIYNRDNYPLLSWRVHLLPYLGHADLHQMFKLNEPWNSEHNKSLLARIPPVYQSPDRPDEKTNYQLVVGQSAMFSGQVGNRLTDMPDGIANTAMLVEVDHAKAVPWSQPIDYTYDPEADVRTSLNGLRDDGFFMVWANASVGRISPDAPAQHLRAMFTRSGKEAFKGGMISLAPTPEVDPEFAGRLKPLAPKTFPVAGAGPGPAGVAATGTTPRTTPGPAIPPGTPAGAAKPRLPVPDEELQKKSQELFREIFREAFVNAKSPQQKSELAKKFTEQAAKITADPPGRYVLLMAASKMAADAGDVTTAAGVIDQLIAAYEVKPLELKSEIFLRAGKQKPFGKSCNDKLIAWSDELLDQALLEDNFQLAQDVLALGQAAAKRNQDPTRKDNLAGRRREIELAKTAFTKVEKVVDSLKDDPEDPAANLTVGRYLCFIKHHWDRGLPMLAKGNDDGLNRLANQELTQPLDPDKQTELADAWWQMAEREKDAPTKKEMFLRSIHWYLAAAPRLPSGLVQVKAELRIKEGERVFGKDAVESLRLAQKGRT